MGPVTHIPTCTYLNVQDMSIHRYLRIIGPVIIMRSTLTGTSTGYMYSIHHATSIAMTSYLLALASIPYIGRCHSALEVESVYTCTSLCDKEMGEPKDT